MTDSILLQWLNWTDVLGFGGGGQDDPPPALVLILIAITILVALVWLLS